MTVQNEALTVQGESGDDPRRDVVDVLLAELKADQGGARTTALRRALDIDASTSNAVRLDRLESTVNSLAAYADALQAFLDENGRARTVLEDHRTNVDDRLDAVEARTADLESSFEAFEARVEDRFDEIESTVEAALDDIESELESRIDAVESSVDDLEADVDDSMGELEDEIAALERRAAEAREWRESLESGILMDIEE